jgi:acetylornithine deacetylase
LGAVRLLGQAVRAVRADRGLIEGAPFWSEAPFLINRLGVPAVYWAPGDISNCHTLEEHVLVKDYLDGIIAFAAFIAAFDGSEPINPASASSQT